MTDRSIVTALQKCSAEGKPCAGCPYANTATLDKFCDAKLMEDAVELINHQEAMIDKLNAMVEAAEDYLHPLPFRNAFDKAIEKARAEAIKEFAERLKANEREHCQWCNHSNKGSRSEWCDEIIDGHSRCYAFLKFESKLDNLVKEMVGEDNER